MQKFIKFPLTERFLIEVNRRLKENPEVKVQHFETFLQDKYIPYMAALLEIPEGVETFRDWY